MWTVFMDLSIGHVQYLSFCRSLTSIILRSRAPIVEYFDDEKYSKQYCEIYNFTAAVFYATI